MLIFKFKFKRVILQAYIIIENSQLDYINRMFNINNDKKFYRLTSVKECNLIGKHAQTD